MVHSCQADESVNAYFDGLIQDRVQAHVGLLVGKQAVGSKDLLLAVVPTPRQDTALQLSVANTPASASKPKAKATPVKAGQASVQLDKEWVCEHVVQVSRMLPGGVVVLGVYLFCPESAFVAAAQQVCEVLHFILSLVPQPSTDSPALFLQVDSGSRKMSLKGLPLGAAAAASSLKPSDLKFGAASASSLVCLTCRCILDTTLPVLERGSGSSLKQQLQQLVAAEAARCREALLSLPDDTLPDESQQLMDALPVTSAVKPAIASLPTYALNLLRPPAACCPSEQPDPPGSTRVLGQARLTGTMVGVAVVHKRDSVRKALRELKEDLARSLHTRMEVMLENMEGPQAADQSPASQPTASSSPANDSADSSELQPLLAAASAVQPGLVMALPRRVILPGQGCLCLGDYLYAGETSSAAVSNAAEIFDLQQLQADQILELEHDNSSTTSCSSWNPLCASKARSPSTMAVTSMASKSNPCTGPLVAGLLAASAGLVAIAVAYAR